MRNECSSAVVEKINIYAYACERKIPRISVRSNSQYTRSYTDDCMLLI